MNNKTEECNRLVFKVQTTGLKIASLKDYRPPLERYLETNLLLSIAIQLFPIRRVKGIGRKEIYLLLLIAHSNPQSLLLPVVILPYQPNVKALMHHSSA